MSVYRVPFFRLYFLMHGGRRKLREPTVFTRRRSSSLHSTILSRTATVGERRARPMSTSNSISILRFWGGHVVGGLVLRCFLGRKRGKRLVYSRNIGSRKPVKRLRRARLLSFYLSSTQNHSIQPFTLGSLYPITKIVR